MNAAIWPIRRHRRGWLRTVSAKRYLVLGTLSAAFAFAVLRYGGVVQSDWNISLALIGAAALLHFSWEPRHQRLDRVSKALLAILFALMALQIVPLPVPVIRVISPWRAELAEAASPILGSRTWIPLTAEAAGTAAQLAMLAACALVFFIVRDLLFAFESKGWIAAAPLLLVGTAEALLGLAQYSAGNPDGFVRGTYINRNHFAGLLVMCLPFAAAYAIALSRRQASRYESHAGPALKACALLGLAAVMLLAILRSLSRAGFLACITSISVLAVLSCRDSAVYRARWIRATVAGITLFAFICVPSVALQARFVRLFSTGLAHSDARIDIWHDSLALIKAVPAFGCGLGAFESSVMRFRTAAPEYRVEYAHDDYLQYLAELGVVAFVVGLLFLVRLFAGAWRAGSHLLDENARFLTIGAISAVAGILIYSLTDFNLCIPSNMMLFAWIAGILSAVGLPEPQPS